MFIVTDEDPSSGSFRIPAHAPILSPLSTSLSACSVSVTDLSSSVCRCLQTPFQPKFCDFSTLVSMTDEKVHRLALTEPLVLDEVASQAKLARLILHHRDDFLSADLSQQAAMIRYVMQQMGGGHGFVTSSGEALDHDAVILGISRVFYTCDRIEEVAQEEHAAVSAISAISASATGPPGAAQPTTTSATATTASPTEEDQHVYECLTNLRGHARLSPLPPMSFTSAVPRMLSKTTTAISKPKKSPKPPKQKRASKMTRPVDGRLPVSDTFPTPKEVHQRAAAIMAVTQVSPDLPRGVTVRPSGRWQAQVYYAGASRYLGVYTESAAAAMAFLVAKQLLTEVYVVGAEEPEITAWFHSVRDVVIDLVQGARGFLP